MLQELLGHQAFRPHQEECIRSIMEGKDLLAVLPTGAGKSTIFQVPAILLCGRRPKLQCLVISPLVSLISDQVDALNKKLCTTPTGSIARCAGNGGPVASRSLDACTPFIFITPERLRASPERVGRLSLCMIVVDEAHCISAHGLAFREDYRDLNRLRQLHPATPICALTATASRAVRADIVASLGFRVGHATMCAPVDRGNLKLMVAFRRNFSEDMLDVAQRLGGRRGIVYFQSRDDTERGAEELRRYGVQIAAYHAGISAEERRSVQGRFVAGELQCMAATIAFGMGIDVSGIRCVVHYGLPGSLENYLQEIGRAGRDGAPAECRLYWSSADVALRVRFSRENLDPVLAVRGLHAMLDFAQSTQCLRRHIAAYFEDVDAASTCTTRGGQPCCKCEGEGMLYIDYGEVARCLLKTIDVVRTGATKQLDYHCGKSSAASRELRGRLNDLQYAAGAGKPLLFWKALHERLREGGYVRSDVHGACSLTPLGQEALGPQEPVVLLAMESTTAVPVALKRKAGVLDPDH